MESPEGRYQAADLERFVVETSETSRSEFERDRARVVHSAALRRLAAKTQVVGPSSNDFTRNRLTHSLEVAQVGRDLATSLGCAADVVEAACLAHDLGHPPFGHNGEAALNEAAASIGGFEGNAQTLRLLTRLEAKRLDDSGRSVGLNLTRAVLDAATKYPWSWSDAPEASGRHGDGFPRQARKFGVYEDDREIFEWMRSGAPAGRTCIEAQVMDFADDVAYSVHDVEDGVVAGRIDLTRLAKDEALREAIWCTARDWYLPDHSSAAFEAAYERLRGVAGWPTAPYDGSRAHLARLKNLTSLLIGRFCRGVQSAVEAAGLRSPLVRYGAEMTVPQPVRAEIAVLKGVAAHLVMKADDRVEANQRQRHLLHGLVAGLVSAGEPALEPMFRADWRAATDDGLRLRVVIDQVASLTDLSAEATFHKLAAAGLIGADDAVRAAGLTA